MFLWLTLPPLHTCNQETEMRKHSCKIKHEWKNQMRKTEMLVEGQELSCMKTGQPEGSYPGLRK
jgi:hypothetical protein